MNVAQNICVLVLMTFALSSGCGKKEKSMTDHFLESQGTTVTPHGRIIAESVRSVSGNKIQYETDGGGVFQITAEKQNGGYKYSAPEKIK